MIVNLISVTGWETGNYDAERCNNGGAYWQYAGAVTLSADGQHISIEIEDTSCGDFGQRWSAVVAMPDGTEWCWGCDEVDNVGSSNYDEEEVLSFFHRYGLDLVAWAEAAHEDVGLVACSSLS